MASRALSSIVYLPESWARGRHLGLGSADNVYSGVLLIIEKISWQHKKFYKIFIKIVDILLTMGQFRAILFNKWVKYFSKSHVSSVTRKPRMSAERTYIKVALAYVARESDVSPAMSPWCCGTSLARVRKRDSGFWKLARRLGYESSPSAALRNDRDQQYRRRNESTSRRPDERQPVLRPSVGRRRDVLPRRGDQSTLDANMLVDDNNVPQEWPRLMVEDRMDGLMLVGERLDQRTLVIAAARPARRAGRRA